MQHLAKEHFLELAKGLSPRRAETELERVVPKEDAFLLVGNWSGFTEFPDATIPFEILLAKHTYLAYLKGLEPDAIKERLWQLMTAAALTDE